MEKMVHNQTSKGRKNICAVWSLNALWASTITKASDFWRACEQQQQQQQQQNHHGPGRIFLEQVLHANLLLCFSNEYVIAA